MNNSGKKKKKKSDVALYQQHVALKDLLLYRYGNRFAKKSPVMEMTIQIRDAKMNNDSCSAPLALGLCRRKFTEEAHVTAISVLASH